MREDYDSRTERNTDLNSSHIILSVFLSVRESTIRLRLSRTMFTNEQLRCLLAAGSLRPR
jgi:hypothetical protein